MVEIIIFTPLIGALASGLLYKYLGEVLSLLLAVGLLILSCILSWYTLFSFGGDVQVIYLMPWIESGTFNADWSVRIDRLTCLMFVIVTTISSFVHIYSFEYMKSDHNWGDGESYMPRFFAYLSFFTFTMLVLVCSENLVQLFFGWEGVGFASYLLIGFYYKKETANAASMKAFIVNRVGDIGLALAIFAVYAYTDTVHLSEIFDQSEGLSKTTIELFSLKVSAIELISILFFIGAMGKSAQMLFHTWLPDAMEGPTPVSALLHAATMVTAGVFLVTRLSPLFEYATITLSLIMLVGGLTSFFAASLGIVQFDIKRVIAYSTCSQLGFMFVACGTGAYQAAIFHLFTHAFFKALLFLCAGSIIYSMHHEQDMRFFGGLKSKLPRTYLTMIVGTLAITGVGVPFISLFGVPIGFSGFVSKDVVIESSYAVHTPAGFASFWLLILSAAMTSFYSWRLIFLTFHGVARGDRSVHEHAHEGPPALLIPLYFLAFGATLAGMLFYDSFVGDEWQAFWGSSIFQAPSNETLHHSHDVPGWVKVAPFLSMLLGFGLAFIFYILVPSLPGSLAQNQNILYRFLVNKWYFDDLYDFIFVRPTIYLGRKLWSFGDEQTFDGSINFIAVRAIPLLSHLYSRVQTGYLYHYALAMIVGLLAILSWFVVVGGAR